MTKYLESVPFSSRPATKEYLENWDDVFAPQNQDSLCAMGIPEAMLRGDPLYNAIGDNLATYNESMRNMRHKITKKLIRPKK
jgi:hypothetical protein